MWLPLLFVIICDYHFYLWLFMRIIFICNHLQSFVNNNVLFRIIISTRFFLILLLIHYQLLLFPTLNLNLMTLNLILIQCLWILIFVFFSPYIYSRLNKLAHDFFIYSQNRIYSYASNASIMYIFFYHIITQKVCFYHTIKFSYFSF